MTVGRRFVAALIAAETLPWGRAVTYGTAALLLLMGVVLMVAPDAIPGLTVPGDAGSMDGMDRMDDMRMP